MRKCVDCDSMMIGVLVHRCIVNGFKAMVEVGRNDPACELFTPGKDAGEETEEEEENEDESDDQE